MDDRESIRHTVPGAKNRDEALAGFWDSLTRSNGTRRTPPEELVEVVKVREVGGLWTVHYRVPRRVSREILRGGTT